MNNKKISMSLLMIPNNYYYFTLHPFYAYHWTEFHPFFFVFIFNTYSHMVAFSAL